MMVKSIEHRLRRNTVEEEPSWSNRSGKVSKIWQVSRTLLASVDLKPNFSLFNKIYNLLYLLRCTQECKTHYCSKYRHLIEKAMSFFRDILRMPLMGFLLHRFRPHQMLRRREIWRKFWQKSREDQFDRHQRQRQFPKWWFRNKTNTRFELIIFTDEELQ